MKKVSVFLIANLVAVNFAFSQNGMSINPTGATADSSAILDVNTTNQEILIPRLTGSGWYMPECSVPSITGQPVAQTICRCYIPGYDSTAGPQAWANMAPPSCSALAYYRSDTWCDCDWGGCSVCSCP